MTTILIVESNTPEMVAEGGSNARPFLDTLPVLDADLTLKTAAPYQAALTRGDLDGVDGVMFSGSGVDWSTADARAEPLARAMRLVFEHGLPVWGSCNGMQLAASVLGGDVGASPNGVEIGLAQDLRLTDAGRSHPMMQGRRDGDAVPCIHRDEVQRLPEGAVVLAGNAHSPVQAFAYERDGIRFWGVQYHPEFSPSIVAGWMAERDPQDARHADLQVVETDAEAAGRLGTSIDAMTLPNRARELTNWLTMVRGG